MAPKKVGQVSRLELVGVELLESYPEIMQKFIDGGWFEFCCTSQGHHGEISMLFAKNFDGFQTQVGNVLIQVTKNLIGETCHFHVQDEIW